VSRLDPAAARPAAVGFADRRRRLNAARCRRFFDPAKYRVVLFDQRGCGRSTPCGCLVGNTTAALVRDLEALRVELGLGRCVLFGGSWGAALALAYAQAHPLAVAGIILRGLTLMRRRDVDWLLRGGGAHALYPAAWRRFLAHLPPDERGDPVAGYYRRLTASDQGVQTAAARAWGGLEAAVGFGGRVDAVQVWEPAKGAWAQHPKYRDQQGDELPAPGTVQPTAASDDSAGPRETREWTSALGEFEGGPGVSASLAQALLTCHYCAHDAFLAPDQLLAGAQLLAHPPIVAVHGRQDHICPPGGAHDLHAALPSMELRVVPGVGHSMYEAPTVHELVWAGERMHALLTGGPPPAPPGRPRAQPVGS